MVKTLKKIDLKDFVFVLVGIFIAFLAQFVLYLSHNVDVPLSINFLSNSLLANEFLGAFLYIVAGVLFVFGIKGSMESFVLNNNEKYDQTVGDNKISKIFIGAASLFFIVALIALFIVKSHVGIMFLLLIALSLIGVAIILLDQKESFVFKIKYVDIILIVLFALVGVILYGFNLDAVPLKVSGNEALFGLNVLQLASIGVVKDVYNAQCFLPFLQSLFFDFFGTNVFSLRALSVLFSLFAVILFFLWSKQIFSQKTAIVSTLIFACAHLMIALSRVGDHYTSSIFVLVLAFNFLTLSLKKNSYFFMYLAGISAGFSFYLHKSSHIVIAIIAVYLFILFVKNATQRFNLLKKTGIFLVSALLVIIPLLVKDSNGFFSNIDLAPVLSENSFNHMKGVYKTENPVMVFFNNTVLSIKAFNSSQDNSGLYGNNKSMLDFVSAVFFVLAFFASLYLMLKDDRYLLFIVSIFLVLFFSSVLRVDPPAFPDIAILMPIVSVMIGAITVKTVDIVVDFLPEIPFCEGVKTGFLVIIVLLIVALNLNIYFNYYIKNNIKESRYHIPTLIGNYIGQMGAFNTIYLVNFKGDSNVSLSKYETVKFLAKGNQIIEIEDAENQIPIKGKVLSDMSFIYFNYNYDKAASLLKKVYPIGKESVISNDLGQPVIGIYEVKN